MHHEFVVIILTAFHSISVTETSRQKRIMSGFPISGRAVGYDAVRYYAWISNANECDIPHLVLIDRAWAKLGGQCVPEPGDLKCGGALITPSIVQTACHCLANFNKGPNDKERMPAKVRGSWENLLRVYLGANSVEQFGAGAYANGYIVHQKCATLVDQSQWIIHDYGWLKMAYSVYDYKGLRNAPFNFAPMYSKASLAAIWRTTLNNRLICLYIGHGEFEGFFIRNKSPQLRHGWAGSLSYKGCYHWTKEKENATSLKNYLDDATWHCTLPFAHHNFEGPRSGDSGGPVTCDNRYFSIVSQGKIKWIDEVHANYELNLNGALAFAIFENAVEYRRSFMRAVEDYDDHRSKFGLPTFRPYTGV